MQPRCSTWQGAVRGMAALAMLAAWGLTGFADPPPAKTDPPKPLEPGMKDLDKLQGAWMLDSLVINGVDQSGFKATLVYTGQSWVQRAGREVTEGTSTLNPQTKPRTIDITPKTGPHTGKTLLGIYTIDGDTYRSCVAPAGKGRPTDFSSKPGTDHLLFRFHRIKSLPKEIVQAWTTAGAEVGWMQNESGFLDCLPEKEGVASDLPAFRFSAWTEGLLATLPVPVAGFGLDLTNTKATDAALKELGRLKSLQALSLVNTQVTGAGLKELAGLKNLQALDLSGTKGTDAGLKELAGLKSLHWLNLNSTEVTDAGLKHVARLKSLHWLNLTLTDAGVTDAGLKALAGLKLKTLNLPAFALTDLGLKHYLAAIEPPTKLYLLGWKVTDEGLKQLAGLKGLQALDLRFTQVTNAGLKQLAGLTSLQSLSLDGTPVTDEGLKELLGLKNLQALSLAGSKVTDQGLKQLAGLKGLQTLSLGGLQVTDMGLKELAGLKNLHSLSLRGSKVTDTGLKELAGLKTLQSLDLGKTKVTGAGLKELAGLKRLQGLSLEASHNVPKTPILTYESVLSRSSLRP